jgi:3'-phosphoadenosine 5'-phosphosulfate sulfotransferase (PAPS reductase)/FAD synthetase
LSASPESERQEAAALLLSWAEAGQLVWRDEWSPLRWCPSCNVPLLQDSCGRCGAHAGPRIEINFPCNPRPVLPHDEAVFRAVGLPWPVDHSVLLNNYWPPGCTGWQVIHAGRVVGDIRQALGESGFEFERMDAERNGLPAGDDGTGPTIDDMLAANLAHLNALEQQAIESIRQWRRKKLLTFTICTFSGGKDSAVLAHICSRSGVRMRLMQIDTGIDPAGNVEYSDRLLAGLPGIRPRRILNDDMFWRALEKLGPPAHDFQWCRTVLKNSAPYRTSIRTAGLLKLLRPLLNPRVLVVDGPRRREEPRRIELKPFMRIPDSPIDTVTIRPILDFTDLDIWMYLRRHAIPFNPTYTEEKQQRLLCLFCPDKDKQGLDHVREQRPEEWARFEAELRRWQALLGYPDAWVTKHLWVFDKPTTEYTRDLGLESRVPAIAGKLNSAVKVGPFEQTEEGCAASGAIEADFDAGELARWLQPMGKVRRGDGAQAIRLTSECGTLAVGEDGQVRMHGHDEGLLRQMRDVFVNWTASHLNCIGCGACRCAISRIALKDGRAVMPRRCPENFDAVREATWLCPLNGHGVWRCTKNRQDG